MGLLQFLCRPRSGKIEPAEVHLGGSIFSGVNERKPLRPADDGTRSIDRASVIEQKGTGKRLTSRLAMLCISSIVTDADACALGQKKERSPDFRSLHFEDRQVALAAIAAARTAYEMGVVSLTQARGKLLYFLNQFLILCHGPVVPGKSQLTQGAGEWASSIGFMKVLLMRLAVIGWCPGSSESWTGPGDAWSSGEAGQRGY